MSSFLQIIDRVSLFILSFIPNSWFFLYFSLSFRPSSSLPIGDEYATAYSVAASIFAKF